MIFQDNQRLGRVVRCKENIGKYIEVAHIFAVLAKQYNFRIHPVFDDCVSLFAYSGSTKPTTILLLGAVSNSDFVRKCENSFYEYIDKLERRVSHKDFIKRCKAILQLFEYHLQNEIFREQVLLDDIIGSLATYLYDEVLKDNIEEVKQKWNERKKTRRAKIEKILDMDETVLFGII